LSDKEKESAFYFYFYFPRGGLEAPLGVDMDRQHGAAFMGDEF
jgi:hypothetical protein